MISMDAKHMQNKSSIMTPMSPTHTYAIHMQYICRLYANKMQNKDQKQNRQENMQNKDYVQHADNMQRVRSTAKL